MKWGGISSLMAMLHLRSNHANQPGHERPLGRFAGAYTLELGRQVWRSADRTGVACSAWVDFDVLNGVSSDYSTKSRVIVDLQSLSREGATLPSPGLICHGTVAPSRANGSFV